MQLQCKIGLWMIVPILASVFIASPAVTGEKSPSAEPVASINGSTISRAAFDRQVNSALEQLYKTGDAPSDAKVQEIRKEALEHLIQEEILYQESQKKGIKADKTAVNSKWMAFRSRFRREVDFTNYLKEQKLSESAIKFQFERDMAIQKLIDREINQNVTVTDKEVKAYYDNHLQRFIRPETVRVRHILITFDPQGGQLQKDEAREKFLKVQRKLENGGDFAVLAKEFSQDPSRIKGGDLGYIRRGQMMRPFEEAAFALKPGEVSDLVETKFGYHLIKVIDKQRETTVPFTEVKGWLTHKAKQEKVEKEFNAYVEDLKKKTKVEVFLADVLQ